ncbi:MAG: MarR family transcriptional regulator [Myxococcales bacterium]|nr:MarR family transcriptional regulator [Myxococcales bacterium]
MAQDILEPNVFLNLIRAHERYWGEVARFLKGRNLTVQQYHVLQILGSQAADEGLPMLTIADALPNRVPDVTRLINRMERDGLVHRARSQEDRRVVQVSLTGKGRELVDVHDELTRFHTRQLSHMERDELSQLNELLVRMLEGA